MTRPVKFVLLTQWFDTERCRLWNSYNATKDKEAAIRAHLRRYPKRKAGEVAHKLDAMIEERARG
jgi:hypothetical protein